MPLTTFERLLPWSGAVAGLCWIGQATLQNTSPEDVPGAATTQVIHDHLGLNYASQGCLVVMGIALLFFATAVRSLLRSGEASEATYSSVAYGGWVVVVAGLSQMVDVELGPDQRRRGCRGRHGSALTELRVLLRLGPEWASAWPPPSSRWDWAASARSVLPRWFAILTIVLGVLGALGDAGIPPGGLVNYLLLPFWLITASFVVARSYKHAAEPSRQALVTTQPVR